MTEIADINDTLAKYQNINHKVSDTQILLRQEMIIDTMPVSHIKVNTSIRFRNLDQIEF